MLKLIEVELKDLIGQTAGELLSNSYRADCPVALICRIPSLGHVSISIASPLNYYLCAVRIYARFFSSLADYTYNKLINDDSFYDRFLKEIKLAKGKVDTLPRPLFYAYSSYGNFGSSGRVRATFGKRYQNNVLQGRLIGCFVKEDAVADVLEHYETQFLQFSSWALHEAPESINSLVGLPGFCDGPPGVPISFDSPDFMAFSANVFLKKEVEVSAMARLREIVCDAENGVNNLKLFPLHIVKYTPSVVVVKEHPLNNPSWERALLRSRLINALRWPWHYDDVCGYYSTIRGVNKFSDQRDEIVCQILETLKVYICAMEDLYPVLLQDPITKTT